MLKLPKIIARTLSIRLSLMVVMAIASLLLASLAVMFLFSRQAVKKEAMKNAEQTLEGTILTIDNILLSVEQATGNIYFNLMPHIHEPESMSNYCRQLVLANPYIIGCAIAFEPNHFPGRELFMTYVYRSGNSLTTTNKSELVETDTFADRPYNEQSWYTSPIEKKKPGWIEDPLKDKDAGGGEAITTFSLPIYNAQGQPIGVLAADVAIGLLSQLVQNVKPSPNGYCILLGRNGSFIVHPDTTKLYHQTVFSQTNFGTDPSVKEAADAMVARETGYKKFKLNGHVNYVFYKPFKRAAVPGRIMDDIGWSTGVVFPEDDIFLEYKLLLYYVLAIAIIGLLLLYLLCRAVTHKQLQPLQMLTLSAQRIADGNYDEVIPDTKKNDEIGLLQKHFQNMQHALAAHVSELERLRNTLSERGDVLREAYRRTQEADRIKTVFLHNMTNQMTAPATAIDQAVDKFHDITVETPQAETERLTNDIHRQSDVITDLLNHLLEASDTETGKEGAHE